MSFKFVFNGKDFKSRIIDRRVIRDEGKGETVYLWFLNLLWEVSGRTFSSDPVSFR